jgi:hypothetical protein
VVLVVVSAAIVVADDSVVWLPISGIDPVVPLPT